MDVGSTTQINDSSGLANHGALFNQAARVTPGRVGSHALAVDGVTPFDYALVPDHASLDITGAITLATWVKPELVATQDVMKKATNASVNGYEITLRLPRGKVFVRLQPGSVPG